MAASLVSAAATMFCRPDFIAKFQRRIRRNFDGSMLKRQTDMLFVGV